NVDCKKPDECLARAQAGGALFVPESNRWIHPRCATHGNKTPSTSASDLTLAYRGGRVYASLGNRGDNEQTFRLAPRDIGLAAAKDPCAGAAERLRHQPTDEAGFRRRSAGQRRIALSGFAQARAGGLDHCGVERHRKQQAREVLFADAARTETA